MNKSIIPLLLLLLMVSCHNKSTKNPQGKWIKGSSKEQLQLIEKQFRGFDMAMVETGYRYQELYWAGQDENWDYANYQIDKIRRAVENGLERRPKRAKSSEHFLTHAIPEMKKAINKKDTILFNESFNMLTNSCMSCHKMEKVPYFKVKKPLKRVSVIRN